MKATLWVAGWSLAFASVVVGAKIFDSPKSPDTPLAAAAPSVVVVEQFQPQQTPPITTLLGWNVFIPSQFGVADGLSHNVFVGNGVVDPFGPGSGYTEFSAVQLPSNITFTYSVMVFNFRGNWCCVVGQKGAGNVATYYAGPAYPVTAAVPMILPNVVNPNQASATLFPVP